MYSALTIRIAEPSDVNGIVRLFRQTYGDRYPANELRSDTALRRHMERTDETFYVALASQAVIGVASTQILRATVDRTTGEHVVELGRLCTDPEIADRSGVARQLCQAAMRGSARSGANAWYATVRSGPALHIAASLGFRPTGYTEEHVVGGVREGQMVVLRMSYSARQRRVAPRNATSQLSIYRTALVRSVVDGLELEAAAAAAYPSTAFIVEPKLRLETTRFQTVASERRFRLAATPPWYPTYVDAVIPTDKVELIASLRARGWRLMAFLPAWYRLRFDCVLMSQTSDKAVAVDALILDRVRRFKSLSQEVHHV
jgi:ribosomal protein S18 acetylase RimI-like enzyme